MNQDDLSLFQLTEQYPDEDSAILYFEEAFSSRGERDQGRRARYQRSDCYASALARDARRGGSDMTPFYESGDVTIYCASAEEMIPLLPGVDHLIFDPPFAKETHDGARSNASKTPASDKIITYKPWTEAHLRNVLESVAPKVARWTIGACMDFRHAAALERRPPVGMQFKRLAIWVKTNPMPQVSGDRPSQGWEAIPCLHRPCRSRWNAGGRTGVYYQPHVLRARWPGQKPDSLLLEIVENFTDAGEVILDLTCGSGTTLRAARALGRKAIGVDNDPIACELAVKMLRGEITKRIGDPRQEVLL